MSSSPPVEHPAAIRATTPIRARAARRGRRAVGDGPLGVARAAAGRRLGPYRVEAAKVEEVPKEQRWKLSAGTKRKLEEDEEDDDSDSSEDAEEEESFADVMM